MTLYGFDPAALTGHPGKPADDKPPLCSKQRCCWYDVPVTKACHEQGACGCKAVTHRADVCA